MSLKRKRKSSTKINSLSLHLAIKSWSAQLTSTCKTLTVALPRITSYLMAEYTLLLAMSRPILKAKYSPKVITT